MKEFLNDIFMDLETKEAVTKNLGEETYNYLCMDLQGFIDKRLTENKN